MNKLINKLIRKEAVIGIVGLGYVGLPLMLRYCEVGYKVIGFDIDHKKIEYLSCGKSYIEHIPSSSISSAISSGFEPTTDFSRALETDALILCVPTPLNKYREPNLSFVTNTVETLTPFFHGGQIVSLESTTYPGTTEEKLLPCLESTGLKVGSDIFLVFSPEREDPGNPSYTTQNIPKVCGGITAACLKVGIELYGQVIDKIVPVSSARAAELTKLLENIHRAVNIGLVNELKIVADKMEIDIYEVINAAATKPFGFIPYYPGPGLGGHCIPIDPFYLTWKAKEYGLNTRFIELAGEINSYMPTYVIEKVVTGLNNIKKSVNGSSILILGIAYKKNVDDMRESPSIVLMEKLLDMGANVAYSDPHIPKFPTLREHSFCLSSIILSPTSISAYDCVILVSDHDKFDFEMIKKFSKLIIDTRGRYSEATNHIIRA